MKNKSAIITGSTSGIGLSLAQHLAETGCHIMLNGFGDRHELENLQQELSAQNQVRVLYSDADMTNPEQIADMVQSASEAFGGVDILVNNAGIQHVAPIDEFPIEKWNAIIAIMSKHLSWKGRSRIRQNHGGFRKGTNCPQPRRRL